MNVFCLLWFFCLILNLFCVGLDWHFHAWLGIGFCLGLVFVWPLCLDLADNVLGLLEFGFESGLA